MRDSFIFYRSFFEATHPLTQEQKAQLFDKICEYSLNQNETETEPLVNAMFALIKPQLDANNKRFENGKRGGRPKEETKQEPNKNQTITKVEPNANVNVNVNVNDNVNDKKENRKEKIQVREYVYLTEDEAERLKNDYGKYMVKEFIEQLNNYILEQPSKWKEYKSRDHNLTIRKWIRKAIDEKYYEKKVEQLGFSRFYEYFGNDLTLKYCNS